MAFIKTLSPRIPLVVILGSTGSGKTKLSIELAQRFGGEIISADSMQVYAGLDIITAKATKYEQSQAPHHLLDFIDPLNKINVVEFRNRALKIIDNLLAQNKLPIVVGGTNYYIESILWKILVDDPKDTTDYLDEPNDSWKNISSSGLHKRLAKLDPVMAERLHPNNKRKIIRSLEVYQNTGRLHSDILNEQHSMSGGSLFGGPLRYEDPLIFWLQCDQKILDKRLEDRVDNMIVQGLVQELLNFHKKYNEKRLKNESPDYTTGIFQSIGFKEFHDYLILDEIEYQTEIGQKLLEKGLFDLKMVTKRYSKKQTKWVSKRFLGKIDREVPDVYGLDTSDVTKWSERVKKPAFEIIENYMTNREITYEPLTRLLPRNMVSNASEKSYFCETCKRVFVGEYQWLIHRASKRHKKMTKRKDIPQKLEESQ